VNVGTVRSWKGVSSRNSSWCTARTYAGTCRNASIARWNAIERRFYHWRYKFGFRFVETIKAPEDDDTYDVFYATSVIEPKEVVPFEP
jgi:hypothetical protein